MIGNPAYVIPDLIGNPAYVIPDLIGDLKQNDMELKTNYSDVAFKNDGRLKLLIIVGTRPEIIRLAAVINKCRKYFDCILAHTGQNYDYNLNGVFFKDLKLADPEVYMDAVGEDLGATMGNIINLSDTENLVTVMYCNEIFNPNKPDTYFEPVE